MSNTKPYVAVACVCEKVLTEPDNVASLIRIVDTFWIDTTPSPLPAGVAGALVGLTAYIAIKAGDVTGQHEIGLVLRQPNGKRGEPRNWPVVLNGKDDGANLKVDFNLVMTGAPEQYGLYWWDVLFDGEVLTCIPFTLKVVAPKEPAVPTAP